MSKSFSIHGGTAHGAIELSEDQAKAMGFHSSKELKAVLKGVSHAPKAIKALCITIDWHKPGAIGAHGRKAFHFHGLKELFHPVKHYTMFEGKVWVKGVCRRAFTSRQIFKLTNGEHVEAEVIFATNNLIGGK